MAVPIPKITFMNDYPTPEEVKQARLHARLTTVEAGRLVYVSRRVWEQFEKPVWHNDYRAMHPAISELFGLKTGIMDISDVSPTLGRIKELSKKIKP